MRNHDAVLSALGPHEVFKPSSLLHDSALATSHAIQRSGVSRLVVLSAAAHFPAIPNRIVSFILRNHMRDSLAIGENRARQRSRLDDRASSASDARTVRHVSKPGRCGFQKRFLYFPQSGCGVHARCNRAKEAFSENRGHCEVAIRILMFIAYVVR